MARSIGASIVPLPEKRIEGTAVIYGPKPRAIDQRTLKKEPMWERNSPATFRTPDPLATYSSRVSADRTRNQTREKDFTENTNAKRDVDSVCCLFGPFMAADLPVSQWTARFAVSSERHPHKILKILYDSLV